MEPTMKATLKQQALDAKGPPAVEGWNESTHLIESVIQKVVLYNADPRVELTQVDAAMDRALRSSTSPKALPLRSRAD